MCIIVKTVGWTAKINAKGEIVILISSTMFSTFRHGSCLSFLPIHRKRERERERLKTLLSFFPSFLPSSSTFDPSTSFFGNLLIFTTPLLVGLFFTLSDLVFIYYTLFFSFFFFWFLFDLFSCLRVYDDDKEPEISFKF